MILNYLIAITISYLGGWLTGVVVLTVMADSYAPEQISGYIIASYIMMAIFLGLGILKGVQTKDENMKAISRLFLVCIAPSFVGVMYGAEFY